jgi:hypothetical protein
VLRVKAQEQGKKEGRSLFRPERWAVEKEAAAAEA